MKAAVNGVELDYLEKGSGAAVLLIHGFPLSREIWAKQIDLLARGYRVIAPDLRGHGRSAAPSGGYTMEDQARDLMALMDHLQILRFVPVGHSMGGYIVFAMHRLARDRMSGAALVCTRAAADTPEAKQTREETAAKVLKEGAGAIADSMTMRLLSADAKAGVAIEVRRLIHAAPAAGVAGALRGMAARSDSTPQLSRWALPTLVAAGRGDKIIPPAESESMAKAIPGSKLVWFDRSGHLPMMEEPELFTDALKDFLKRA